MVILTGLFFNALAILSIQRDKAGNPLCSIFRFAGFLSKNSWRAEKTQDKNRHLQKKGKYEQKGLEK
nr:hypothetical protein [uncultured Dysosmobacter sp.]